MYPARKVFRFGAGSTEGEISSIKATAPENTKFQRELQRRTFIAGVNRLKVTFPWALLENVENYFNPAPIVLVDFHSLGMEGRRLSLFKEPATGGSPPVMVEKVCYTQNNCVETYSQDEVPGFP